MGQALARTSPYPGNAHVNHTGISGELRCYTPAAGPAGKTHLTSTCRTLECTGFGERSWKRPCEEARGPREVQRCHNGLTEPAFRRSMSLLR